MGIPLDSPLKLTLIGNNYTQTYYYGGQRVSVCAPRIDPVELPLEP